ncbi:MAG: DUF6527 family protein [Gallionellaceae bacterium]
MNKAHHIHFKGVADKYAGAITQLHSPGDCAIVLRGIPRTVVMMCPDDCGETIAVNLDHRVGKAWRKYEHNEKLTIYPSVWRDTGCRAHFIVWNDRILWCNTEDTVRITIDERFIETVFNNLSISNYVHFESIAESLQAIPWDVLWACNKLVRRGLAQVDNKCTFRKIGIDFSSH